MLSISSGRDRHTQLWLPFLPCALRYLVTHEAVRRDPAAHPGNRRPSELRHKDGCTEGRHQAGAHSSSCLDRGFHYPNSTLTGSPLIATVRGASFTLGDFHQRGFALRAVVVCRVQRVHVRLHDHEALSLRASSDTPAVAARHHALSSGPRAHVPKQRWVKR